MAPSKRSQHGDEMNSRGIKIKFCQIAEKGDIPLERPT